MNPLKTSVGLQILKLIEREKVTLMSGNFEELEKIFISKERALRLLRRSGGKIPENHAVEISKACKEVDALYDSVNQGLRAAQLRLQSLRAPNDRLETYDINGHLQRTVGCFGGRKL